MIKLTEATYEELRTLLGSVRMSMLMLTDNDDPEIKEDCKNLSTWEVQILTAIQIVKDRETTNQN